MSLGGGTFLTQNKVLPGAYMNFISVAHASATLSDRGTATLALGMEWGPEGEMFTVELADFLKNSQKIFGYDYTADELKPIREIFKHAKTVHFFRLNADGTKAANTFATAKYSGARGNALRIVIEANENSTVSDPLYDVSTFLNTIQVDYQEAISEPGDLKDNDFVTWNKEIENGYVAATSSDPGALKVVTSNAGDGEINIAVVESADFYPSSVAVDDYVVASERYKPLALTASMPLTGGTTGTVENVAHQNYLDQAESYTFNAMGCVSADPIISGLYSAFCHRMRDDVGKKFQVVCFHNLADDEGVVSVKNGLKDDENSPALIPWVVGVVAGTAVNKSATNMAYDGEYEIDTKYTQTQLEAGIKEGSFMFHLVDGNVVVLTDINTFVSITDEKSSDFSSNQTIRVLDQIANDIAVLFAKKYLGKVPNDAAGRISLWNDIVKHHNELQTIRAIEDFDGSKVTVAKGDTKKAVVVTDYVTPVNAMEQLYMTVYVQ